MLVSESVDKIICVGKNYLEHAREMAALSGDAIPEKPVLFLKPFSALLGIKGKDPHPATPLEATLPSGRGEMHPECELVLKLGSGGSNLSIEEARRAIYAVTIGLDGTLREEQARLKKAGHPWEISKVFPASAITGPWVSMDSFEGAGNLEREEFTLTVNGELRQRGRASDMILGAAECVAYASRYFPLLAGDLLYTGTPAGVRGVRPGDEAVIRFGERLSYVVRWH